MASADSPVVVNPFPASAPGASADCEIAVQNQKSRAVEIFRLHPSTFEEEPLLSVLTGGAVRHRCLDGDSLVAKIGQRVVSRFTACAPSGEWRLYEDHEEREVECSFTVENRRAEAVTLYQVAPGEGQLVRVRRINSGERIVQESFEGRRWLARVGQRSIAAYQVTPRLPVWALGNAENEFMPVLPIGGNSDLNEAAETSRAYQRATGDVKAVMVFIEFPDVRHQATTAAVATRVVGHVKEWYRGESYGRLRFEVTPFGDWLNMARNTTDYSDIQSDGNAHIEYIRAALSLFADGSVNYGDYDIAYIVAAKTPDGSRVLYNSPTLSAGIEVPTNNGTVRHVVTFGRDCYERSCHVLLHETGHLFGLPDLYLFNNVDWLSPVGAWDIMCHLDLGQHFLGWHKYKLGWLDESQLFKLKSAEVSLLLHPFEMLQGIKMLVIESESASKVYVVEIAQSLGEAREYRDKGVLVYTVDAAAETGKQPVAIVSGRDRKPTEEDSARYGPLCAAYLAPGATQTFELGERRRIEVTNERQVGSAFQVKARQFSIETPTPSRAPGVV
jgi:M6 family metalloprotease-like protein